MASDRCRRPGGHGEQRHGSVTDADLKIIVVSFLFFSLLFQYISVFFLQRFDVSCLVFSYVATFQLL